MAKQFNIEGIPDAIAAEFVTRYDTPAKRLAFFRKIVGDEVRSIRSAAAQAAVVAPAPLDDATVSTGTSVA